LHQVHPVEDKASFEEIEIQYATYDDVLSKSYTQIPNVTGMSGMDALSLLENIGLKVEISGVGKVKYQSLKKGEKLVKGNTITLKLS
jgi:cell division protein FtsI (penicillin-binding protein 3)